MAELAGDLLEISIKGPSPFGFRLYGGGDGNPLIVAKLRARGKSRGAGLEGGDVVLGINGVSCQTLSHGTAMALIEASKDLLRLHLYRGSTDRKSLSTAYGAIADQLRPLSSGSTPVLISTLNIQPSPFEVEQLTSYFKQEVTSSVEADVTHATATETRPSDGGVKEEEEEVRGFEGGTVPPPSELDRTSSCTMFHVPKIKRSQQPMRWAPKGTSELNSKSAVTVERDEDKENLTPNDQTELVEIAKFPAAGGGGQPQQQQQFRAAKQQWVWQPTGQREREPSLATNSEVLDRPPHEPQPQQELIEESLSQREHTAEAERTGSGTPPRDLSPHLVHILTTEGTSDDCTSHRKNKKIFADSSFYDEPEHKYPTIEEQIKMARQVALSLSAAAEDNVTARGQQMFRKRKEKAAGDGDDYDAGLGFPLIPLPPPPPASSPRPGRGPREKQRQAPRLFYNPAPWKAPQAAKKVDAVAAAVLEAATEEKEEECHGDPEAFTRNRAVFERDAAGVERREPPWKKTPAPSSSPSTATSSRLESAADPTKDLSSPGATTGGRGAKLFAQKRAKALKDEEEEEDGQEVQGEWFGKGAANGFGETGDHVTPDPTDRDEIGSKADLTPWKSKAVGQNYRPTPWRTAPAAANDDAKERGRSGKRSDEIPSFLAEKIPSLTYRPVKFQVA